jgi:hypothetical protein
MSKLEPSRTDEEGDTSEMTELVTPVTGLQF